MDKKVLVSVNLLENCLDAIQELIGQNEWRRGTSSRNDEYLARLESLVGQINELLNQER